MGRPSPARRAVRASAAAAERAQRLEDATAFFQTFNATPSGLYTLLGALESLITVGGELRVTDSYLVPGSTCFESVASVGGDLVLSSLAGLITVDSFGPQLPSLTSVGGTLDIEGASGFTDLDLIGASAGLWLGGLSLDGNGSLVDATAPLLAVDSSGSIAITNNASLCQSDAQAFVAAQAAAGWAGVATVSGNMACP